MIAFAGRGEIGSGKYRIHVFEQNEVQKAG